MAMNYLNSFLGKQKSKKVRKVRADAKISVRVYVSDFNYRKILKNSRLRGQTITAYVSDLISQELQHNDNYELIDAKVDDHCVHIKLTQSDHEVICNLIAKYKIPYTRHVTSMVLHSALAKERF